MLGLQVALTELTSVQLKVHPRRICMMGTCRMLRLVTLDSVVDMAHVAQDDSSGCDYCMVCIRVLLAPLCRLILGMPK